MKKVIILIGALVWAACSATLVRATFGPEILSARQEAAASAEEAKPKFGTGAVPIQQARDYLRRHEAPDFWALMPYYVPQTTGASCSAASVTMLVNALRGVPSLAKDALVTEASLLETVGAGEWIQSTAVDGEGVSFAEFETYLRQSLKAYGLGDAEVEVFRPEAATPAALARLREMLSENEKSADDFVLAVYNQGVVTGDADVGHISPIGAYDGETGRALILDVDRKWYVPYWVGAEKLLESVVYSSAEDPERGGLIRVKLQKDGDLASVQPR